MTSSPVALKRQGSLVRPQDARGHGGTVTGQPSSAQAIDARPVLTHNSAYGALSGTSSGREKVDELERLASLHEERAAQGNHRSASDLPRPRRCRCGLFQARRVRAHGERADRPSWPFPRRRCHTAADGRVSAGVERLGDNPLRPVWGVGPECSWGGLAANMGI